VPRQWVCVTSARIWLHQIAIAVRPLVIAVVTFHLSGRVSYLTLTDCRSSLARVKKQKRTAVDDKGGAALLVEEVYCWLLRTAVSSACVRRIIFDCAVVCCCAKLACRQTAEPSRGSAMSADG
jgi:hypothetical protein